MTTEHFEETFSVDPDAPLKVRNVRGTVTVRRGEAGSIKVTAVKHLDSGNPERTEVSIKQEEDGKVAVSAQAPNGENFWKSARPCKVDFHIEAPETCTVFSRTVSASTSIEGLQGDHSVKSVSGQVSLRDLQGALKVKSVSGDVRGEGLHGALELSTVSGRSRLTGCDFAKMRCKTVSGNVHAETPLGEGPYLFKSVSGKVRLIMPEGTGCHVKMRSMSGKFKTSLRASRVERHGRKWYVDVNGGGPEVRMGSMSGGLALVSSETDTARRPEVERPSREERLDILAQVEQGSLSVEEAAGKLGV